MRSKEELKYIVVKERHAEQLILCMNPCEQAGGAWTAEQLSCTLQLGFLAVLQPTV